METDVKKICACKGIRSCLACENAKGIKNSRTSSSEEDSTEYVFCPLCGFCWPNIRSLSNEPENAGFYLPGILLVHDFVSKEEERDLVSNIDQISWVPSQSGRRKQDFGPKVNFKKHKVKVGNFVGFPEFAAFAVDRLASVPSVSNFLPVELCNLEYCPERGSAIEPHVDDFWLWGDRLITLNLLSETVLTLTPVDGYVCSTQCRNKNFVNQDLLQSSDCEHTSEEFLMSTNCRCSCLASIRERYEENPLVVPVNDCCNPCEVNDLRNRSCVIVTDNCEVSDENYKDISMSNPLNIVPCSECECLKLTSLQKLERTVKIPLPPRSLLVLYSCARYHWLHAIKRSDIKERRLAMTFRELSSEFMPGGSQAELGKELLEIARIQIKS